MTGKMPKDSAAPLFIFVPLAGTKWRLPRSVHSGWYGEDIVIGRQYLVRQAATLLEFARSTANPELSAVLIEKAADLKSRVDETGAVDCSPIAPDVVPETGGGSLRSASGRE